LHHQLPQDTVMIPIKRRGRIISGILNPNPYSKCNPAMCMCTEDQLSHTHTHTHSHTHCYILVYAPDRRWCIRFESS